MNTSKSEGGIVAEPASGETLGTRFLIDDPDKGWRVISAKRVFAAQRGELLMPELANRTIRVADADVGIRSGKLVTLLSVTLAEWHIDAGGRVEQAGVIAGILDKLDHGADASGQSVAKHAFRPNQADLESIRIALGLPRT